MDRVLNGVLRGRRTKKCPYGPDPSAQLVRGPVCTAEVRKYWHITVDGLPVFSIQNAESVHRGKISQLVRLMTWRLGSYCATQSYTTGTNGHQRAERLR